MTKSTKVRLAGAAVALVMANSLATAGEPAVSRPIGPDELSFSVENMDRSADPRVDFYRYASGAWLDRTIRPDKLASIGVFEFMLERLKAQLVALTEKAAADAPTAPKGSPAQQVGDFYRSYMDVPRLDAAGVAPLQPEFDRIDAIASFDDLATYLGHYTRIAGDLAVIGIVPSTDQADATRTALYVISGKLGLTDRDVYREPPDGARITAYRIFLEQVLAASGFDADRARRVAATTIDLERSLADAMITPVEAVDPRNTYNPLPFAEVQARIATLDLARYLAALGASVPDTVVLTEPRYLPALASELAGRPLDEIKDYLRVKLILRFADLLGTGFDEPFRQLSQALVGVGILPPREERAQDLLKRYLGHPFSRLYVEAHFDEGERATARDMVERIRDVFRERIGTRTWLAEPTRQAALGKLEALSFRIGHPDEWIDVSGVEVRPDDLVGNVMRLVAFDMERTLARIGKPVVNDQFADVRTLPVVINAAYNSQTNGFEVPAAILQPAAFEADRDAAVYFCRIGAVIGHEMTHGFDSGGRLFDATGNMRDWWTPSDAGAFEREARKLIDQANAFEVLPGLPANGELNVRENMADVGGITFAHEALLRYLADHPAENVPVDGLTPSQRCFLSWAQMWAMKATEQTIRSQVSGDGHPPGSYRAVAALQHLDAFYEAFGIKEGDPMWLAPEKRVHAW